MIIFSEFRKSLDWVGHLLIMRFGDEGVAQHWGRWRKYELSKFKDDGESQFRPNIVIVRR